MKIIKVLSLIYLLTIGIFAQQPTPSPTPTVREEVTVIASGIEQPIEQVSKTVNSTDSQEIKDRNEFSVTESLRTIPGFRIQQLGGFGKTASIKTRGLRNQDTAILLDGLRFRDASAITGDASPFLSDITLTNVDRIEVLRGSGSSLYGTNAIGGTIDFLTPKPSNAFHGGFLGEFGSLGLKRFRGNFSGGSSLIGFNFGLSRTVFSEGIDKEDDARNTNVQSRIEFNPFSKTNISARFFFSDAFVRLNNSPDTIGTLPATTATVINAVPLSIDLLRRYANGETITNVGNANFIPDANDPDNFQRSKFLNAQIVLTQAINERAVFQGFYSGLKTRRANTNGPLGVGFQPFGGDETYDFDGQIHTIGGNLDWRVLSNNRVKFGYEYELEKFGNEGVFVAVSNNFLTTANQSSNTFFVQDLLSFLNDKLQFSGAFRAQWFSLDTPAFSSASYPNRFDTVTSPPASYTGDGSVSYFIARTGTKLRAHIGNGYRVPSLYERFGSYFFLNSFFGLGNPELKPERSIAFDGGVDQTLAKSKVRLSATAFYTEIRDEIAYLPTDDLGAPAYFNFDKHFSRGAEFSVDAAPCDSTRIFASYTFTNSDIRNFRRQSFLPPYFIVSQDKKAFGIPDHQFTFVFTQSIKRLTLNLDLLATSSYLAPVFSNTTFGTYTYRFRGARKADVTAAYEIPTGKDKFRVRLFGTIENLLGYDYYENGFGTAGRTARGGLGVSF